MMKAIAHNMILLALGLAALILPLAATCMPGINETNELKTDQQMESHSAYFKTSCAGKPDQIKLVEHARQNQMRLDSVYATVRNGEYWEKRKWFFVYDGSLLKEREEKFYGESYADKFDLRLQWHYDENLNLVLYEEYDNATEGKDSIIRSDYTQYTYNNNKLVREVVHEQNGGQISVLYDEYGNQSIGEYEIYYQIYDYSYEYDQSGLLFYRNWTSSNTGWNNPIFYEEYYHYNENGQLVLKYSLQDSYCHGVDKYYHIDTDSLRQITNYRFKIKSKPMADIDVDALVVTTRTGHYEYSTSFDVKGRDSIYSYYEHPRDDIVTEAKIAFIYNSKGQLERENYFLRLSEYDITDWIEQVHVYYTYDDLGNLINYRKIYKDLQYNEWYVLEEQDYYYSAAKSFATGASEIENTIRVYPNPARNFIKLSVAEGTYSILDFTGRTLVKDQPIRGNIDIRSLKSGVYLLQVNDGAKVETLKFVKE